MADWIKFVMQLDIHSEENEFFGEMNYEGLPDNGYAIPMILHCLVVHSNEIVENLPRYSSADHVTMFYVLNKFLTHFLERKDFDLTSFEPYFNEGIGVDEKLNEQILIHKSILFSKNFIYSLKYNLWSAEMRGDQMHFSISINNRRKALDILSTKAHYMEESEAIKVYLDHLGEEENDMEDFVFEIKLEELKILYDGIPNAWQKFSSELKYDLDDLIVFRGFLIRLRKLSRFWYKTDHLYRFWEVYVEENGHECTRDVFEALLDLYSITPQEGSEWGIQTPFIRVGEWYAFWLFYFHAMHPDLTLVSLWHRKHQQLWNNTIGANLAGIATYLEDGLAKFENVTTISEKKIPGISDIDLGIFDAERKQLVLIEVKTVFDKFRTNYQYNNFVNQKVNYEKANSQLRRNTNALKGDNNAFQRMFGTNILIDDVTITSIILTWWDISYFNLAGENKDILSCNFKTFKYLYGKCNGDIESLVSSIRIFTEVDCVGYVKSETVNYNGEEIVYTRELQTDLLPPLSILNIEQLPWLTKAEILDIQRFPENWKETLPTGEAQNYVFY